VPKQSAQEICTETRHRNTQDREHASKTAPPPNPQPCEPPKQGRKSPKQPTNMPKTIAEGRFGGLFELFDEFSDWAGFSEPKTVILVTSYST
jgi:hypothetical protein